MQTFDLRCRLTLAVLTVCVPISSLLNRSVRADGPNGFPSKSEVEALVAKEPVTKANWPIWKKRLLAWIGDRSRAPEAAFDAARSFVGAQANADGQLTGELADDAFAWYELGSYFLYLRSQPTDATAVGKGEAAFRKSIILDPNFARAHRNLALALILGTANDMKATEAGVELSVAAKLDPQLPLTLERGLVKMKTKDYAGAEAAFDAALRDEPDNSAAALYLAQAIVSNANRKGSRAEPLAKLSERFPAEAGLVCFHGVGLAMDSRFREAVKELDRAKSMGADPDKMFAPGFVDAVREATKWSWFEIAAWGFGGFVVFYAVVMSVMALGGLLLASRTRGDKALALIGDANQTLLTSGQIARTHEESTLAKLYLAALMLGLLLFYLSLPFVTLGILAVFGSMILFFFWLGRIPIKLVVLLAFAGIAGAWSVISGMFAGAGRGSFGLQLSKEQIPRLHGVVEEVAKKVETGVVNEIYIAPGAEIGVHQEGRGPFGLFGSKRRVLTLGMAAMHVLTVAELKSILAHEYAHFSHQDTFYSRFIYQVTLSIRHALGGMAATGGLFHYINPSYWFLVLYFKSYALLSAGFSRSREFLADRMAATLYGSDVFATALKNVSTDGALYEIAVYQNLASLLEKDQALVNMYDSFRQFRDGQVEVKERDAIYARMLEEKAPLFASHPSYRERLTAIAPLPKAETVDSTPAIELFEAPDELQKELTEFLAGRVVIAHQQAAQT